MRPLLYTFFLSAACLSSYAQTERLQLPAITGTPAQFTPHNNRLYFTADNGSGDKLWQIASSTAQPQMLDSLFQYSSSTTPWRRMVVLNDILYFCGRNDSVGEELFAYDGSNAPYPVADIRQGSASASPEGMMVLNGIIYFSATTVAYGRELCSYDPVKHKISMEWDTEPGSASSNPYALQAVGNQVCFVAQTQASGRELNVYDPVKKELNCYEIVPGASGSNPMNLTVHNGKLYFSAQDLIYGNELFVYNGSSAPLRLTDIAPGNAHSLQAAACGIGNLGSRIYFAGSTGQVYESMLCSYDTVTRTAHTDTLRTNGNADIRGFAVYNNRLYFFAKDNSNTSWLWRTDGMRAPEKIAPMHAEVVGNRVPMMVHNNLLYFSGYEPGATTSVYRFDDSKLTNAVSRISFTADVQLYPNPATDAIHISVNTPETANMQIVLTDAAGRQVAHRAASTQPGTNTFNISTAQLPAGVYYMGLYDAGGILQHSSRVTKL